MLDSRARRGPVAARPCRSRSPGPLPAAGAGSQQRRAQHHRSHERRRRHPHTSARPARADPGFAAAAGAGGRDMRGDARRKPRAAQAAAAAVPRRPRRAGVRLDRLRDDDGGRLRPARSSRTGSSTSDEDELVPVRRPLAADRDLRAAQQRRHRHVRPDLAVDAGRDRRRRGQALLDRTRASTSAASRAPFVADVTGGVAPGRLDDRPAVRQERARRAGQPDGVREAARGGARLPPHAQVVQGEDPHRVPELDLLRQRRLRRSSRPRACTSARSTASTTTRTSRATATTSGCGDCRHEPSVRLECWRRGRRRCWPAWSPRRRAFDPIAIPQAATARRNLVLQDMLAAALHHAASSTTRAINEPLPTATDIQQPEEPTAAPYFTSWLRPQILAAMGSDGVSAECRRVPRLLRRPQDPAPRSTCQMQKAAEQAISAELPTGSGRADRLAGGDRQQDRRGPRDGRRPDRRRPGGLPAVPVQPRHRGPPPAGLGVQAVHAGGGAEAGEYTPDSVIDSAPQDFIVPNSGGKEHFIVHNFGNTYSGPITPGRRHRRSPTTACSRRSGIHVGTKRDRATWPSAMGIRSPVSNNYAMIIGGLKDGVTPLDMAHAYETFATGGRPGLQPELGAPERGPDRDRPDPVPDGQVPRQARARRHADATSGSSRRASPQTIHDMLARRRPDRHRQRRRDLRRRRRRQDRDDVQLRRRLVRRLDAADHDRRLGRVPRRSSSRWPPCSTAARSRAARSRR